MLCDFPDPEDDFAPWVSFVTDLPCDFRKQLDIAGDASCYEVEPKETIVNPPVRDLVCSFCGMPFANPQELGAHRYKFHGVKSWMRHKITGTVCVVCCKDFRSRTKLHNHVAYRAIRCGSYYASLADIPLELFNELEEKNTKDLSHFLLPVALNCTTPSPLLLFLGLFRCFLDPWGFLS